MSFNFREAPVIGYLDATKGLSLFGRNLLPPTLNPTLSFGESFKEASTYFEEEHIRNCLEAFADFFLQLAGKKGPYRQARAGFIGNALGTSITEIAKIGDYEECIQAMGILLGLIAF